MRSKETGEHREKDSAGVEKRRAEGKKEREEKREPTRVSPQSKKVRERVTGLVHVISLV